MDTDDIAICPYNKEHKMLRKKLQKHIIKCKEIYKNEIKMLVCPFNKIHLIRESDFFQHTKTCKDRNIILQYQFSATAKLDEEARHEKITSEENWDAENAPNYNPEQYASNANIVRDPKGMFRSQRRAFIKEERKRLLGEDSDKNSNGSTPSTTDNINKTKHRSSTRRSEPYNRPNRKP